MSVQPREKASMSLMTKMSGFLRNEKYADLEILVQGRRHRCHRAFVAAQSQFLEEKVDEALQTAPDGAPMLHVTLHDESHAFFRAVLSFIYFSTYKLPKVPEGTGYGSSSLRFHVTLYGTARRYAIEGLQAEITDQLNKSLEANIENPKILLAAASKVYNTLDLDLRGLFAKALAPHTATLLKDAVDRENFFNIKGLSTDVLLAQAGLLIGTTGQTTQDDASHPSKSETTRDSASSTLESKTTQVDTSPASKSETTQEEASHASENQTTKDDDSHASKRQRTD